jgi:hypothetical protein
MKVIPETCHVHQIGYILFLLALGVNATYCYSCADSTRHVCASNWIFLFYFY